MEKIKYDLNKTEQIINQISDYIEKISFNIDDIYEIIENISNDGTWVSDNASYVKNKGIDLTNKMQKEVFELKTIIKRIANVANEYKEVDEKIGNLDN